MLYSLKSRPCGLLEEDEKNMDCMERDGDREMWHTDC